MSDTKHYDISAAMDIVTEKCDGIYIINTVADEYYALKQTDQFRNILGDEGVYSEMFKILMFHMDDSPKKIIDGYMKFLPEIKSFNGRYGRVIKIFDGNIPVITMLNVYPLPEEGSFVLILTIIDSCEYMEEAQTKAKEAVIQEGYLFTMYVNLTEDTCHSVEVTEMGSASQKYNDLKYSQWRYIIVNMIHKDDQSLFIANTEPEYLINRLKDRNSTSFECQMQNLQGVYKWVRLTFSKIQSLIDNEFKFVYMVQDIHESSMRLLRDVKKLEDISNHDALTGVFNHGKIEDELYRYVELGKSRTGLVSLFMMDLDHFKEVNDTFGHAAGDEVLRQLSYIINEEIKEQNVILGRWGGEEFFGICDNTTLDKVFKIAEKIRCAVENHYFKTGCKLTCSIGVIEVLPNEAARAAFARVDKAVYAAKNAGRNCVMRG